MAAPKKPRDRQVKDTRPVVRVNADGCFEFDDGGRTYASTLPVDEVITVGMILDNGNNELGLTVDLLRALFVDQPDAAAALRSVPLTAVMQSMESQFAAAGQATLGEGASSPTL